MLRTATLLATAVIVAATGIYLGVRLYMYADLDDSPGGMVIGMAMVFGSLALGAWIALRAARSKASH